ncbi:MAG TPA: hypothetical protein VHY84_14015 [Bryobacteraceae bacterium]|jgi:hypothetical protein|nr:hypothetical protein [Bryobacteraceae bacterium]
MRRAAQFALTVLTVLLLLRPVECFAGMMTAKAADCCAKGKCLPTAGADECCNTTVPSGSQFAPVKPSHICLTQGPGFVGIIGIPDVTRQFPAIIRANFNQSASPPDSPPGFNRNLPLLI